MGKDNDDIRIYYTDLMVQNNKILKIDVNHVFNLKVLLLTSVKILTPITHLLNSTYTQLENLSKLKLFFNDSHIYCSIPKESKSFDDYYNNYFKKYSSNGHRNELEENKKMEAFMSLFPNGIDSRYSFEGQKTLFTDSIIDYINEGKISNESLIRQVKSRLERHPTSNDLIKFLDQISPENEK